MRSSPPRRSPPFPISASSSPTCWPSRSSADYPDRGSSAARRSSSRRRRCLPPRPRATGTESLILRDMPVTTLRPGLGYDPELACRHLCQADPRLGELIARAGPFTMRPPPPQSLFAALVEAIVYQQLSGKAAATILRRVVALYRPRGFPRPQDILETAPERLPAAGVSAAKNLAGGGP